MKRLLLVALFVLTACESQREARWVADAGPTCEAYGFPAGTPEHAQCKMVVVENKRSSRDAALAAIAAGGLRPAVTCTHYGNFSSCR